MARVRLEGWRRANDPDAHGATRVRSDQQGERLDEMYELDFVLMHEFVQKYHSFIVPDLYTAVLAASCNQAQVVSITATDDVFLVALGFASLDHLGRRLRAHHLIHVDLDRAVPSAGDNCVVFSAVPDERNLSFGVVRLKLLIHNSRLQVKDPEVAMVAAYDELAVVFVEDHLCDFIVEDVFDDAYWLARASVPDLNIPLAGYEDFQPFLAKNNPAHGLVVCELGLEGPCVLEDSEVTGANDQTAMLRHGADGLNLVCVRHIERLNTAVVEDVPQLDHGLDIGPARVGSYETIEIVEAIHTYQWVVMAFELNNWRW